jgi:hypothetical protein
MYNLQLVILYIRLLLFILTRMFTITDTHFLLCTSMFHLCIFSFEGPQHALLFFLAYKSFSFEEQNYRFKSNYIYFTK